MSLRLSRPLYEALPWIYILCGLVALLASYFQPARSLSLLLGVPGLLGVVGGFVLILRRRDYRQLKANNYLNGESPVLPKSEE